MDLVWVCSIFNSVLNFLNRWRWNIIILVWREILKKLIRWYRSEFNYFYEMWWSSIELGQNYYNFWGFNRIEIRIFTTSYDNVKTCNYEWTQNYIFTVWIHVQMKNLSKCDDNTDSRKINDMCKDVVLMKEIS